MNRFKVGNAGIPSHNTLAFVPVSAILLNSENKSKIGRSIHTTENHYMLYVMVNNGTDSEQRYNCHSYFINYLHMYKSDGGFAILTLPDYLHIVKKGKIKLESMVFVHVC